MVWDKLYWELESSGEDVRGIQRDVNSRDYSPEEHQVECNLQRNRRPYRKQVVESQKAQANSSAFCNCDNWVQNKSQLARLNLLTGTMTSHQYFYENSRSGLS